jgi:hypothetical protein
MTRRPAPTSTCDLVPPRFAPLELVPLAELQDAAATAPTVRRLQALVEWLGEGRKLIAAVTSRRPTALSWPAFSTWWTRTGWPGRA